MVRLIHSLSDLVTGTAVAGQSPLFKDSGGWSTVNNPRYDVRAKGATGDGATDDTSALAAAIAAAKTGVSGNGYYVTAGSIRATIILPPGVYRYRGDLTVSPFISFEGSGKHLTALVALDNTARLVIDNILGANACGPIGGFTLDGDDVGVDGLFVDGGSHIRFYDLDVMGWTGDGITLSDLQNCNFDNVNAWQNGRGQVLDNGTGSCHFNRCEYHSNVTDQLAIVQDTTGSAYDGPAQNTFTACVIEHAAVGVNSLLYVDAGLDNLFVNCVFATGLLGATVAFPLIKVRNSATVGADQPRLTFFNCKFSGNVTNTTAFDLAGFCVLTFVPENAIIGAAVGYAVNGGSVQLRGKKPRESTVTTHFSGSGGATENNAWHNEFEARTFITRLLTTDGALDVLILGEAGARWALRADGLMQWMDGSSFSYDTNLYRNAANVLKTDDKFIAALGIGVGNSAAATTLGTVAKKMEVFDASGASIGFVALYDAIT